MGEAGMGYVSDLGALGATAQVCGVPMDCIERCDDVCLAVLGGPGCCTKQCSYGGMEFDSGLIARPGGCDIAAQEMLTYSGELVPSGWALTRPITTVTGQVVRMPALPPGLAPDWADVVFAAQLPPPAPAAPIAKATPPATPLATPAPPAAPPAAPSGYVHLPTREQAERFLTRPAIGGLPVWALVAGGLAVGALALQRRA